MGKIVNTSKRGIILILTLCILLCTSGLGAHAISVSEENIVTAEETTVVVEETTVATEKTTAVAAEEITIATEESAVAIEETTDTIEAIVPELMPMMARGCEPTTIYVNSSINISGNEPNATYVYCSGGGGPISGGVAVGTIYSIAQMDNFGRTIWRQDLNSYNGMPLHHGSIYGPHQHNYTWSSYTNSSGTTFWNFIEDIFGLG